MKKIIVVIGTPYSGKDTHSKLLAEKLNFKYCSFDDVVNEEIKNKTKIGLIMQRYLNCATQTPDEYFIMLMKDIIINLKEDGIVFNDFPKTIAQAKALDSFLFMRKTNKPIAINLNTQPLYTLKRVIEKTEDTTNEIFGSVMNLYELKTKGVIEYYSSNAISFDTSKNDIEITNEEILKRVK